MGDNFSTKYVMGCPTRVGRERTIGDKLGSRLCNSKSGYSECTHIDSAMLFVFLFIFFRIFFYYISVTFTDQCRVGQLFVMHSCHFFV